ncbi:MAG TPA: hypothetical protein VF616_11400, partial [Duganella sp.]|uniref:hypothetical protein n=1 Tax=Duganella sp. TaxID=1904440 RepID=UPI002ED30748
FKRRLIFWKSQPCGWLFFRPRTLPEDARHYGGRRVKIPVVTLCAELLRRRLPAFFLDYFCKRTTQE